MSVLPDNVGGDALSPCVEVCSIDETTGYCYGCGRTLSEIADWPRMTPEEKRRVLAELDERKSCFY